MGFVVALSVAAILGVLASLLAQIDRPYPGFFFSADYRVFPVTPAARARMADGDRIVAVDGQSPLTLMTRVSTARGAVGYEIEGPGGHALVELAPAVFSGALFLRSFALYFAVSSIMLAAGLFVYAQNPIAGPNRSFLLYMCLWAVSNVAVPEATLGIHKYAAILVSFVPPLLSVHGWVFFLTYPVNPARQAWLERHRVISLLYGAALSLGIAAALIVAIVYRTAPELLVHGWLYPAAVAYQFTLAAMSFPIKIAALLDTRRRAAGGVR
jgi:hypothetical protein